MMNGVLDVLTDSFGSGLAVFLAAAIPVTELRGAIPLAVSLGISPWRAFVLAFFGNLLPVPLLLVALDPVVRYVTRTNILGLNRFFDWLYARTLQKSDKVDRYGALGLILFTAVPLPTTGAWTACVAASIFRIRFRNALLAISCGIFLAGMLITFLSVRIGLDGIWIP